MTEHLSYEVAQRLGPSGFYLGLRIRFAFPAREANHLPRSWVELYSREKFFFADPSLKWSYEHTGAIRLHELEEDDPLRIIAQAREHGLRHGAVASYNEDGGLRSYGLFYRDDREYDDAELALLADYVMDLHRKLAPPQTLTRAELDVLRRIKDGGKLKQIASEFGVSEGAIKQRLKNARLKLNASNGTQAASLAATFGLI